MKRREFLRTTVLTTASVAASAVNSFALDRDALRRRGSAKRIIIIGAGLAGLSAAYELTQAGHDVTILEARSRPGGRVHTLRDAFAEGVYAEAGATRIPNHHHFTLKYVKLFNLSLESFEPAGLRNVYHMRGKQWARGVSSFYKPGEFSSLQPHVARPEGRIYFAGEHTSVWIDGWMQGALESDNRVAREVNDAA